MASNRARLDRYEARQDQVDHAHGASTDPAERAQFAWYDASCPCGLPPGECKEHPRAGDPAAAGRRLVAVVLDGGPRVWQDQGRR